LTTKRIELTTTHSNVFNPLFHHYICC